MKNYYKKLNIYILIIISLFSICACSISNEASINEVNTTVESNIAEDIENNKKLDVETKDQLKKELGAFDITAHHRALAAKNIGGYPVLDAGRGNPNYINTKSRYAFVRFMDFAIKENELAFKDGDMAGHAIITDIDKHFDEYMDPSNEIDKFIIDGINYCVSEIGCDKSELIKELVDGITGDYYPSPSRALKNCELIIKKYIQRTLFSGVDLFDETEIFPCEGGSAAMAYIFESMNHNYVLREDDKIAIGTPIFTPYIQLPHIKDYNLQVVKIQSTEEDGWDISDEEIEKLGDPNIKAFFLVNPANPSAHALKKETLQKIKKVVEEKNPNLIILTDDVYGTFVKDFQTLYSVLPHNTILVYSYSKLYGVTGWRTGLIAMDKDNVIDKYISELPEDEKEFLNDEYAIVTTEPENMKFIDRVVADSRSIGLYHTSGLATPAQVFMAFMSLTNLIEDEDAYINASNALVSKRYKALIEALHLDYDDSIENDKYYTLISMYDVIEKRYGTTAKDIFKSIVEDIDFLEDLAYKKGVVVMYGPGFEGEKGSMRFSLANLNEEDYVEIARRIYEILDEYYEEYTGRKFEPKG